MQTPQRFRTKRQLWAYCGLALRTYDSYRTLLSETELIATNSRGHSRRVNAYFRSSRRQT
jgi:transposase